MGSMPTFLFGAAIGFTLGFLVAWLFAGKIVMSGFRNKE